MHPYDEWNALQRLKLINEQMSDGMILLKMKMNGKFGDSQTFIHSILILCHLPNGQVQFARTDVVAHEVFFFF